MIITDLFETALVNPGFSAGRLLIVSGYATAAFAREHMLELKNRGLRTEVSLVVGMPGARNDHLAFLALHREFEGCFYGYYVQQPPPVHCKMFAWFDGNNPVSGFAGSANYSGYGFRDRQQMNQLCVADPILVREVYQTLRHRSVYMPDARVEAPSGHTPAAQTGDAVAGGVVWDTPGVRVRISFLARDGSLPASSGLNWGQRRARAESADGRVSMIAREPNQAYLSLKGDSRREGFLPNRAIRFTLITDDGVSLDCVRAQDGDKAIHSTDNNSILGRYFRKRLGVPQGVAVTRDDLIRYGRTDYTIEKLDEETFLLDLSLAKSR